MAATSTLSAATPRPPLLLTAVLAVAVVVQALSDDGLSASALGSLVVGTTVALVCFQWGCWTWLCCAAALPALLDDRMLSHQDGRVLLGLVIVSSALLLLVRRVPMSPALPVIVFGAACVIAFVLAHGVPVASGDPGIVHLHVAWPVAGALALVGLAAALGVGRAEPVDLRLACVAAVLAGTSSVAAEVSWWPAAGALGVTALLRGRRGRGTRVSQRDQVDEAALAEFRDRYGNVPLGPVAIVIAAYNEADGIPAVLETLPEEICRLHVDVIVVDDGSTDCTAAALERTAAHVVSCRTNRGQGAALRLGYRVAREHGAAYIVTTDADGQYAVTDMPALLVPILEDRADFVTGSRILGHQQTRDRVRRAGVHVFAWLATVLTGRRFTDTSFGLRAMRAEVTGVVTLNQPQYQSSELLLGVVSHGFRTLEVPGTMNLRSAGSTKKGRNVVYGRRYARAMTGTWLREGLPRPVSETAPALRHTRGHGN
ncbi:MAG TPA: glycosyltransferase family 2 protein [Nocardioides sp.]|uniref:glycosyltransferase family 2 protein n=1 Tax=Nocardioides sp. TaxID=35761 RepID=UPI002F4159EC